MRRHGLQLPLDPHQVASWIVFFALASGVYAFFVPFVEDAGTRWFLVALYSVLVLAMTVLDLYTSALDPSDPGLKGNNDGEFFCGLCQASVSRTSKHCRACDRCVEGFDHHCKWLNNCVGSRNYWQFFALISSTCSLLLVQFAWGLWLFVRSFTDKSEMQTLVHDKYGGSVVYGGWQAALAIYLALLVTAEIMLGELFFFHVVLITKGMTTYDYIVSQRDAKLAAPPPPSGPKNACGCRSSKVSDSSVGKRRVKVGINPCAAILTAKPKGSPAEWGAPKGSGKGQGLEDGVGKAPPSSEPPMEGKAAFDAAPLNGGAGSGGAKEGLEVNGKVGGAASVHELVARAVAEQGRAAAGGADSALLAMQHTHSQRTREAPSLPVSPGPQAAAAADGCVPECSAQGQPQAERGGSSNGPGPDFTVLDNPLAAPDAGPSGSPGPPSRQPSARSHRGTAGPTAEGAGFDAAMPAAGRHLGTAPASPAPPALAAMGTPLRRRPTLPPLPTVSPGPRASQRAPLAGNPVQAIPE